MNQVKPNNFPIKQNLVDSKVTKKLEGNDSTNKHIWGPFKPIPNVKKFKVKLNGYDLLYKSHGIEKRIKPEFKYETYVNKGMNRYMEVQLKRMKYASDHLYWVMAKRLITKSNVYLIICLNHVFPNWHRDYPLGRVLALLKETRKLATSRDIHMDYRRVYIEKANSKWRPLGVPTPVWRLYLHMINQLIVFRYDDYIGSNQHGFRPGRGTMTAWKAILERISSRDIYEYDYRGFFDSIRYGIVLDWLSAQGLPQWLRTTLNQVCKSVVKLTNEDKIPEPDRPIRTDIYGRILPAYLNKPGRPWTELHPDIPQDLMIQMMKEDNEDLDDITDEFLLANYETYYLKYLELQAAYLDSFQDVAKKGPSDLEQQTHTFPDQLWDWKDRGVPQGAPISPFLSILGLHLVDQERPRDIVRYADDFILFGNNLTGDMQKLTPQEEKLGLCYAPEKCGWVKKDGIWLKPLKFLGLTYDGETDKLYASTRKGATLEFDKGDLVMALKSRESEISRGKVSPGDKRKKSSEEFTWHEFIQSSVFGFMQARMYGNSWSLENVEQDFELDYVRSSWVWSYLENNRKLGLAQDWGERLTVFNSSSFACKSLMMILKKGNLNKTIRCKPLNR